MNKLKKMMMLAALACPMMAAAADFPWLTFKLTDSTEMSVASDGLAINYNEGTLLLKSATVDLTIASDQVKSMRFTTTAAAVDGITDTSAIEADYFDLSGKKLGRYASTDNARKMLPSGTYIMRSNEKTIKIIF